ncbi:MAG: hypothetical protein K8I00_06385, partial [Candidatus Omnitrophica bacterium]|nr:hypothetical protein [Candidatus Omnitrophota bacterium]
GGGGATFELENAINVNGTLSLTSGMLDTKATENNAINVGGNWLNDGGTFDPRQATVVFDATAGSPTIISNNQAFYNIEFDDTGNNITFTLEDALDINGTLRITGGNLDTKSGENNSIHVAGNWLNQDLFTARNGIVTLDGTMGSPTITSGGQAFYFLDIDDSDFNVDFLLLDPLDVNGTLMITSGTLDVNAAGNYMINVGGAWSSQDTFLARTGTVSFDATSGTPAIYSYGQSFYNIDFDDGGGTATFLLEDALDVNGTLRINNGTLDVKLGENNDIAVFGNWINYDTFLRRAGDVTLDGDDQDIRGTTTFYDLTKLETTDDSTDVTVTFDVTGSLIIDNVWTFSGLDADDRIVLLPSVPVTQWDIDPQGVRAISYLDPTYSRNVNVTTIQCTNGCNDGGNNINWNFTAGVITVSGSVYIDEGMTSIGAGTAVRLDVNGVADNTDTTDGSGSYSITSSATVGNGAIVTLYLDTGGGNAGVTVLVSNGSNVSDADIYRDYLLVRSDNGNFVSNLNMDTANNSGDTYERRCQE